MANDTDKVIALANAKEFLVRLMSTPANGGLPGVPKRVRDEARAILKDYPSLHEVNLGNHQAARCNSIICSSRWGHG